MQYIYIYLFKLYNNVHKDRPDFAYSWTLRRRYTVMFNLLNSPLHAYYNFLNICATEGTLLLITIITLVEIYMNMML